MKRLRTGNVHDSRGASDFISACLGELRAGLGYRPRLEARLDTAFCASEILDTLDRHGVAFTVSMHFTRTPAIREAVERRRRWHRLGAESAARLFRGDYPTTSRSRALCARQAGRLIRPNARLTPALADNEFMKRNFLRMREALAH